MNGTASQLALAGGDPAPTPAPKLTDRQQFALELIGRLQPISSDELGALLCERHGNHAAADRCAWDRTNGNQMGEALRRKRLVRYRRNAGWTLTDWQPTGSGPSAQNTTGDGFDTHGFPRDF